MQKIAAMEGYRENGELVLSYQTIRDVRELLNKFRNLQGQYQLYQDQFLKANQGYKQEIYVARMYVSHFLQVMNMAIDRGELKPEIRQDYGLDPEKSKLPPLIKEKDLDEWGSRVILAEEQRIRKGGVPIYNPNIAKVKVHFSIFRDHYYNMNTLRTNCAKFLEELTAMRPMVDDIILDIWNQVDTFYEGLPLAQHLEKVRQFGVIYFTRPSELAKSRKRQDAEQRQGQLNFGEE